MYWFELGGGLACITLLFGVHDSGTHLFFLHEEQVLDT